MPAGTYSLTARLARARIATRRAAPATGNAHTRTTRRRAARARTRTCTAYHCKAVAADGTACWRVARGVCFLYFHATLRTAAAHCRAAPTSFGMALHLPPSGGNRNAVARVLVRAQQAALQDAWALLGGAIPYA